MTILLIIIALGVWIAPGVAVYVGYRLHSRRGRSLDRDFYAIIDNEYEDAPR